MTESAVAAWYYAKNGQKFGPYTADKFKALAQAGQIQADDLVWKVGISNWLAASQVKGLLPSPSQPPPLPTVERKAETANHAQKQGKVDSAASETSITSDFPKSIDEIDVPDDWKSRFHVLEKAGAADHSFWKLNYRGLPIKERYILYGGQGFWSFGLGFIFGIFYYMAKGLWKKGWIILLLSFAAVSVMELAAYLMGFSSREIQKFAYSFAVIYAMMGGYDYYRLKVHGEAIWPSMSFLNKTPAFILFSACMLSFIVAIQAVVHLDDNANQDLMVEHPSESFSDEIERGVEESSAMPPKELHLLLVDIKGNLSCGNMFCYFGGDENSYAMLTDGSEANQIRSACGQDECVVRGRVSSEELLEVISATRVLPQS